MFVKNWHFKFISKTKKLIDKIREKIGNNFHSFIENSLKLLIHKCVPFLCVTFRLCMLAEIDG